MPRPSASVTVTRRGPGAREINAALAKLKKTDVLVGIPADRARRREDGIDNASLLFIHSKGSPLQNIPPRPVLEPAVEKSRGVITPELAGAAKAVLDGNPTLATQHLNRAGMLAANAAKRYFTDPDNGWAPNAPSTIRAKGSDKPLINKGEMRRAITYAVRENGNDSSPEHFESVEGPEESTTPAIAASESEAVTLGGELAEIL